jgi:peptide/nickel transport system permease protein
MSQLLGTLKQRASAFISLFKRSPTLIVGVALLSLIIFLAIFAPIIDQYRLEGHKATDLGYFEKFLPPSLKHPLGTDHFGRDVLGLHLTGLKFSLIVGALAGGVATLISVCIAVIAGYRGGIIDSILNGVTNSVLVIPSLPILIVVAYYTRLDLVGMCLTLAAFSWPWSTRVIRAQVLTLKERTFVDLARVSGQNGFEIMFAEILPNLIPYIIVGLGFSVIGAIFAETGLRIIGLGPPTVVSLGLLLQQALQYGLLTQKRYAEVMSMILLLMSIFISLNLINKGMDEAFNPRLKKVTGQ